ASFTSFIFASAFFATQGPINTTLHSGSNSLITLPDAIIGETEGEVYFISSWNLALIIPTHIGQQQDESIKSFSSTTSLLNSTASLIVSISAKNATSTISAKPIFFSPALICPIDTFAPNCPTIAGATAAITF